MNFAPAGSALSMLIRAAGQRVLTRIGLISDSHGRAATTQRAVQLLIQRGAQVICHLGDVGNVDVIDALVERLDPGGKLNPAVHLIFGNCDWDAPALGRYAKSLGIKVDHPVGRLKLDGKTIVLAHGHQQAPIDQALAEGVDYLFHGHTHRTRDEMLGPTHVVNPGALFRAAEYTVALVEVENGHVEFLSVPDA